MFNLAKCFRYLQTGCCCLLEGWTIKRSELQLGNSIGKGEFGGKCSWMIKLSCTEMVFSSGFVSSVDGLFLVARVLIILNDLPRSPY